MAWARSGAQTESLPEKGVVVGGNLVARVHVRVHSNAGPARGEVGVDLTALRPEILAGILGQDPELDGVAARDDVGLGEAEGLAGRDPDLQGDEVDAGAELGDGMLHLDAAVDLDEVGVALGVDEELQRAQVLVAGRRDGPNGPLGQLLAGGIPREPGWASLR